MRLTNTVQSRVYNNNNQNNNAPSCADANEYYFLFTVLFYFIIIYHDEEIRSEFIHHAIYHGNSKYEVFIDSKVIKYLVS